MEDYVRVGIALGYGGAGLADVVYYRVLRWPSDFVVDVVGVVFLAKVYE